VDYSAPGRHPQHVAASQQAFIAIASLALDDERHDFKSGVRVGTTCTPASRKIEPVIRQDDERVVVRKLPSVDHVNRRVTLADESWPRRGKRLHLCEFPSHDPTLRSGDLYF
jgi:hypothetical protein